MGFVAEPLAKRIKNVDRRTLTLLRAAFEAGAGPVSRETLESGVKP